MIVRHVEARAGSDADVVERRESRMLRRVDVSSFGGAESVGEDFYRFGCELYLAGLACSRVGFVVDCIDVDDLWELR